MQQVKQIMKITTLAFFTIFSFGAAMPSVAEKGGDMMYLVEFTANAAGTPTSREQAIQLLETMVIPSLDKLAKENNIRAGGLNVGARSGVFVLSATSHDEATRIVRALPAWGVWDWTITPLESFAHRASLETKMIKELRTMK